MKRGLKVHGLKKLLRYQFASKLNEKRIERCSRIHFLSISLCSSQWKEDWKAFLEADIEPNPKSSMKRGLKDLLPSLDQSSLAKTQWKEDWKLTFNFSAISLIVELNEKRIESVELLDVDLSHRISLPQWKEDWKVKVEGATSYTYEKLNEKRIEREHLPSALLCNPPFWLNEKRIERPNELCLQKSCHLCSMKRGLKGTTSTAGFQDISEKLNEKRIESWWNVYLSCVALIYLNEKRIESYIIVMKNIWRNFFTSMKRGLKAIYHLRSCLALFSSSSMKRGLKEGLKIPSRRGSWVQTQWKEDWKENLLCLPDKRQSLSSMKRGLKDNHI